MKIVVRKNHLNKRLAFGVFCMTILTTLLSCGKFLDTVPRDFVSPDEYYTSEEHLTFALAGVYDILGKSPVYGDRMIGRLAMDADEMFYARSTALEGVNVFNYSAAEADILNLWRELYNGINRANLLLANIDKPEMDDSVRNVIKGETLFLRAYYYFLLASNWGGVPIVLNPTQSTVNNEVPRSSLPEVYQFITDEMMAAEPLVPTAAQWGFGGRISKSTVRGMLARVFLHWAGNPVNDTEKYQHARDWAKKVIDSDEHELNPDYSQVFINYAQDLYDVKESIWEVEFWGNSAGAQREIGRTGNNNGIATSDEEIGFAYGFINATARLYHLYEEHDTRRDWAIAPFRYVGKEKQYWQPNELYQRNSGKWRREYEVVLPKSKNDTPQNFPLLRYSDVLLMFAEAENELNGPTAEAHAALNQVRERAQASLFVNENAITDRQVFFDVIMGERSRELCFESLRKSDLIRWGVFVRAMKEQALEISDEAPSNLRYGALAGNNVSERHMFFPIPVYELALNRELVQNPGW